MERIVGPISISKATDASASDPFSSSETHHWITINDRMGNSLTPKSGREGGRVSR